MRKVREVTAEEENFRLERVPGLSIDAVRRDPAEPEPVGGIVLLPFRVTGYDPDFDGSLMARLSNLWCHEGKIDESGWDVDHTGIDGGFVVTEAELLEMWRREGEF